MTKERYEELKKQGGTIWHWEYGEIKLEDTDICEVSDLSGNHTGWNIIYFGGHYDVFLELEDLEEDPIKGKWKHKMTAERTERFEPPMREEIENFYDFRFIVNNKCLRLYVRKDTDCIVLFTEDDDRMFEAPATKENYEKACEIVRGLFSKK